MINKFFLLQPTVDIEIFPTAIEDWSENSAEDITQEDIDRMIVKYPALRDSSKPVNNLDIIVSMAAAVAVFCFVVLVLLVKKC